MSVGLGLAAIRASRERGHRDGRWQARRLHLFQPRLRGGRRRFPGGGRPPTPGPPCSVSRRQHRAVWPHSRAILKNSLAPLASAMSRRPCWPAGRLPSPSGKRTATTVRASVPIRFCERPPGLGRIFSPFIRLLSDFACIRLDSAVSLPTVNEGLKLFDVFFPSPLAKEDNVKENVIAAV